MTHLLDTDHLSILTQQKSREWPVLVAHINRNGQDQVGASIVSFHEQIRGCHAKLNQARLPVELVRWYQLMANLVAMFAAMNIVPFDQNTANELDRLNIMKLRVNQMDLRIAATALANNLTLVTRNTSDFSRVPGLKLEDWTR